MLLHCSMFSRICILPYASSYRSPYPTLHRQRAQISTSSSSFFVIKHLGAMDPVTMEKLQATKRSRRSHFLVLLIQYLLRVVLVGLFLSSPHWLPIICSSLKFFLVRLPNIGNIVTGPKFIFIVFNIIVIFLVGESRRSKSSAQPDVYDEYVMRSQSLQRVASVEVEEKEAVVEEPLVEEAKEKDEEVKEEEEEKQDGAEEEMEVKCEDLPEEEEEEGGAGEEEMEVECEDLPEEEEEEGGAGKVDMEVECEDLPEEEDEGLPAEELNRRVEDFIAKVNMQRRLEAQMLICYG